MRWQQVKPVDAEGQINLSQLYGGDQRLAFGYAEIPSDSDRKAHFAVGSDDTLTVWINGKEAYKHTTDRGFKAAQDQFEADLKPGSNRVVVKCGNSGGGWQFSVAVRAQSTYAFLKAPAADAFNPESYRAFANKTPGKADHGKSLFTDLKGLACIKCHAVSGEGGTVGPDLSGVGAQYKKDEIIESVLYPSAKIFSGYEPIIVATSDGRVLNGILKSDDADNLVIQDAEDKTISIPKDDIEDQQERRLPHAQRPRRGPLQRGLRRPDLLPRNPQRSQTRIDQHLVVEVKVFHLARTPSASGVRAR